MELKCPVMIDCEQLLCVVSNHPVARMPVRIRDDRVEEEEQVWFGITLQSQILSRFRGLDKVFDDPDDRASVRKDKSYQIDRHL